MHSSRRKFIKKSLVGVSALGLSSLLSNCVTSDLKLTILHTNDVHSQIDPFPKNHSRWPNQGGFARRAELIQQIRKEQEHVLLFDCGDIFQGTPYFNIYKGKLEIELMNKMGYDAATLGNHEFDNGIEALAENVSRADFPFVCSNYDLSDSVLNGLTIPYKIIQKGRLKIGIIGLGIELAGLVNPKSYKEAKYNEPMEVANELASRLKGDDACDAVIVISHLGYKYKDERVSDVVVAENSKNIDVILGGHTHTFMDEPDMVLNQDGRKVIVSQAGWGGLQLGRLDLNFSVNNEKTVALVNSIYHV
ncbi:bifunctional metallophosphatase/5'-nucleotidase [Carboxylicivirga marina]|uniref:Metallophosphatase n=1 Tax=Carboxylicivirga marina TaxID=2800988 RepID=A0ABS1HJX7_9BACT|nr:metallophosphatase [Carboxylicivirga marina]MBK3517982.1 metallophosphatase [Carboxylicivirga marina]